MYGIKAEGDNIIKCNNGWYVANKAKNLQVKRKFLVDFLRLGIKKVVHKPKGIF